MRDVFTNKDARTGLSNTFSAFFYSWKVLAHLPYLSLLTLYM